MKRGLLFNSTANNVLRKPHFATSLCAYKEIRFETLTTVVHFFKTVVQVTANAPLILWSQCSYQGGQKLLGLFPMFQQGYCFMQTNFWEGFEQLKNFCFQTVSFQFEIKARVVIFTNEYSKKIFLLLEVTLWYLQSSIWNPEKWEKVQEIKKWV